MEEKFPPVKTVKTTKKTKKEPKSTKLSQTETNIISPVDKLNVANLSEENFKVGCRITPDNKISIYDAISTFKGISIGNARQFYSNLIKDDRNKIPVSIDLYQFPKSDGKKGQAIPVCTFSELISILSQLPGEEAKILRKKQAEICNLVLQGKEDEIKTIIEARHPNRTIENVQRTDDINPVDKLNIANLSEENFKVGCRITPDNKISIYDAVAKFKGCSLANARTFLTRILHHEKCPACANLTDNAVKVCTNCANLKDDKTLPSFDVYKFDGVGQKSTPVCTFSELIPILSQLPGEEAKILRKEQAQICNLVLEGKEDEIKTIIEARHPDRITENIQQTNDVNPVDKLNIANLSEENFKIGCRITPDNKISIYDAIKKVKGCSDREARTAYDRLSKSNLVGDHFDPQLNLHNKYRFVRDNKALGPPIPVCTFSELMPILSQLPGEEAKILRKEQAEITTRAIAGDSDLKEFVERREKTVPEEVKDVLLAGLERRPHTIEDVHKFYDNMRNNPKYKVSIDLSRFGNKDILYIGIFRPIQEYLDKNISNEILRGRFFCKFGVSGEVIERSGSHLLDDNFIDYTVIKNFIYYNSFGRSSAESRIKTVLKNMRLKIDYCGKKEVFVCNEEELDEVSGYMESHNMEMNEQFEEPFKREFELEKIKLQNQKEIEIQKIQSENQKEIEIQKIQSENQKEIETERILCEKDLKMKKIQHFTDMFERGKITFEQLMEITK